MRNLVDEDGSSRSEFAEGVEQEIPRAKRKWSPWILIISCFPIRLEIFNKGTPTTIDNSKLITPLS